MPCIDFLNLGTVTDIYGIVANVSMFYLTSS